MYSTTRIPRLTQPTCAGAVQWFEEMADSGLIFHPEDDPASIVWISSNLPFFRADEVSELQTILNTLDSAIGPGAVIDAAYRPFMLAAGHSDSTL